MNVMEQSHNDRYGLVSIHAECLLTAVIRCLFRTFIRNYYQYFAQHCSIQSISIKNKNGFRMSSRGFCSIPTTTVRSCAQCGIANNQLPIPIDGEELLMDSDKHKWKTRRSTDIGLIAIGDWFVCKQSQ